MAHTELVMALWFAAAAPAEAGTVSGNLITLNRDLAMRDRLWITIEIDLQHAVGCTVPVLDEVPALHVGSAMAACAASATTLSVDVSGDYVHLRDPGVAVSATLDSMVTVTPGRRSLSEVADEIDASLRSVRSEASPPLMPIRAEAGLRSRSDVLVEVLGNRQSLRELLTSLVILDGNGRPTRGHVVWIAYSSSLSEVIQLIPVDRTAPVEVASSDSIAGDADLETRMDVLTKLRADLLRQLADPQFLGSAREEALELLTGVDAQLQREAERHAE